MVRDGSSTPLLGGLRSSAQMISYELSLSFAVVGPLMLAGSLSLREIVNSQAGYWGGVIPRWNCFPQFIAFVAYLIAAFAETNRVPFDLPEAEGELVAGYHTEYASMKFAMFFTGEYANMVTSSCIATLLFLGGWNRPLPWDAMGYVPVALFFALAVILIIFSLSRQRLIERIVLPVFALVCAGPRAYCSCLKPFADPDGHVLGGRNFLVRRQSGDLPLPLYLDPLDPAPLPLRHADGVRLEVHDPGDAGERPAHRLRHRVERRRLSHDGSRPLLRVRRDCPRWRDQPAARESSNV